MADAWEMMTASQRKALGLASDAFSSVVKAGRAGASGIAQPEETLARVTALIAAVGDLAASSTKPMETLLASQRNLANAMGAFAQLQMEMAEVVERMADSHGAVLDAMESLANPAFMVSEMIRSEPAVEKAQKKTAAKQRTAKKGADGTRKTATKKSSTKKSSSSKSS